MALAAVAGALTAPLAVLNSSLPAGVFDASRWVRKARACYAAAEHAVAAL